MPTVHSELCHFAKFYNTQAFELLVAYLIESNDQTCGLSIAVGLVTCYKPSFSTAVCSRFSSV